MDELATMITADSLYSPTTGCGTVCKTALKNMLAEKQAKKPMDLYLIWSECLYSIRWLDSTLL